MEQKTRKLNRLADYDYGQEGCYFITLCTYNRAQLFRMESAVDNKDLGYSEKGTARGPFPTIANAIIHKWIKKAEENFPNCRIDKYIIMSDHMHLIVTIKEWHLGRSLPDVLRFFKTMTTNEYIRGVKEGVLPAFDKKIWQKSYYDHVVRNQQDYNDIWEYIENNPTKWMVIHNMI